MLYLGLLSIISHVMLTTPEAEVHRGRMVFPSPQVAEPGSFYFMLGFSKIFIAVTKIPYITKLRIYFGSWCHRVQSMVVPCTQAEHNGSRSLWWRRVIVHLLVDRIRESATGIGQG